jgi:amino acid permease
MANMNKKSNIGQGKTQKQYEDSAKAAFYGWCGVLIMVIILVLFSLITGCTTTKKVDECCKNKKAHDSMIETTKSEQLK